jgi:predicted metalloprotease
LKHRHAIARRVALLATTVLVASGCAATIAGQPMMPGGAGIPTGTTGSPQTPVPVTLAPVTGTSGTAPSPSPGPSPSPAPTGNGVPDSAVGLKPGVATATLPTKVQGDKNTTSDQIAKDALADVIAFYTSIFPNTFSDKFAPPANYISYDSNDKNAAVCGTSEYQNPNAAYFWPPCNTVAWDRGVLLPRLEKEVGVIGVATVLAHEMGHRVQTQLKLDVQGNPTILAEQQADCYAGAYWKWVADGNSKYFNFNQTEGMRQVLASIMNVRDPVGGRATDDGAHGNGFDRTYAVAEGYGNGAARCNKITMKEVDARASQFPFTSIPLGDRSNIAISDGFLTDVAATVNGYFGKTSQGYRPPTLTPYQGDTPPACNGYTASAPVDYCPASNTVTYSLSELKRIGTATAGLDSMNGDFSAVIMLVTRYAMAAQAAGGASLSGDKAGLRALCYAGTWATWMRTPQGEKHLKLSPNDLDKAVYQVIMSPLSAGDVNGASSTPTIQRVEAFDIGVTQPITKCFEYYQN